MLHGALFFSWTSSCEWMWRHLVQNILKLWCTCYIFAAKLVLQSHQNCQNIITGVNSTNIMLTFPVLQHPVTLKTWLLSWTASLVWWRWLGGPALGHNITQSWLRPAALSTPVIPLGLPVSWASCSVGRTTLWLCWQGMASATALYSPKPM